jgi:hypothetical protein
MKYIAIVGTARKSTKNVGKVSVIQNNSHDDKTMELFCCFYMVFGLPKEDLKEYGNCQLPQLLQGSHISP